MKDKIHEEVYHNLKKAFKVDFLPRKIVEQEFTILAEEYKPKYLSTVENYLKLKKSAKKEDYSQVLKINEAEYIVQNFKDKKPKRIELTHGNLTYLLRNEGVLFTESRDELKKKLKILKEYDSKQVEKLKEDYQKLLSQRSDEIFIPFFEFFQNRKDTLFPMKEENKESPSYKVREYINELIAELDLKDGSEELIKGFDLQDVSPDYSLEFFKKMYEKEYGMYLSLLENIEKQLNLYSGSISAFGEYRINVGSRDFSKDGYRLKNQFYIKDGKASDYRFVHTQDCKEERCVFVSVFILSSNGRLIKISVSPEKLLQYNECLLFKEVQKVNIVDDTVLEIHIHKHFDPEIIVFESQDKAYKFLSKINTAREGKRNFERRY